MSATKLKKLIVLGYAFLTIVFVAFPFIIGQDIDVFPFHAILLIAAFIYGFKLKRKLVPESARSKGIGILLGCLVAVISEISFLVYLGSALKG